MWRAGSAARPMTAADCLISTKLVILADYQEIDHLLTTDWHHRSQQDKPV